MKIKSLFFSWLLVFSLTFSSTVTLQADPPQCCQSQNSEEKTTKQKCCCAVAVLGVVIFVGGGIAFGTTCWGFNLCFSDDSPSPSPYLRFTPSPAPSPISNSTSNPIVNLTTEALLPLAPSPSPFFDYIPPRCNESSSEKSYARVALTIDGASQSFFYFLRILQANNLTATLFVNPENIGQEGYLSLEELKELANSSKIEVGTLASNASNFPESLEKSKEAFATWELVSEHFASTTTNDTTKALSLTSRRFRSSSASHRPLRNSSSHPLNQWPYNDLSLVRYPVTNDTRVEDVRTLREEAQKQNALLILAFNQFTPNSFSNNPPVVTREFLEGAIEELICSRVSLGNLGEALTRQSPNLLTDGDFDEAPQNSSWLIKDPTHIVRNPEEKGRFPGTHYSLELKGNSRESSLESEQVNVTFGQNYTTSFFVDGSNYTGKVFVTVNEFSNECDWVSASYLGEVDSNEDLITIFSKNYTPTSPEVKKISLSIVTEAKTEGSVIVDRVEFMETPF